MTAQARITRHASVCPHDCPSACALDVEVIDGSAIGRVRGHADNTYTAGVICAKVARYAERIHHPDRLMHPLKRVGPKGSRQFARISWDEALDRTAEGLLAAERRHGPEAVWPYYYAGTMGRVHRDGINRLRHAKGWSGFYQTICINTAWAGYMAGTGRLAGADPREMAESDCVVIWGTNAVATQVNVMTHAVRARKERGAKIVAIDIYMNETMRQADMALVVRPGTDGALACAVMHVLFREGLADREYLARHTDVPDELERHLASRTPEWAAAITGLAVAEIEAFARLVGTTKKSFFRLGYGFSRQRNGATNMHAANCIPVVTGAWQHRGGGSFHNNGAIYHLDTTLIEGLDVRKPGVRKLEQSSIGRVLTGDQDALCHGPPVDALFIQNTNPLNVCPEQDKVVKGFSRDDLFVAVHEQFMTETAAYADIVMPATMFLEHDDFYTGGGHMHILSGPRLIEPPGECRPNHDVHIELARRVGAEHRGFGMTVKEIMDETLKASGWGSFAELEKNNWIVCQPDFDTAHYANGFAYGDGKFRLKPDWAEVPYAHKGLQGPWRDMPRLPDHWEVTEEVDSTWPLRLATSPSRSFLNSTFSETPGSRKREGAPSLMIHPDDIARFGLTDGGDALVESPRGSTVLQVRATRDVKPGVVVAEGLHPNAAHKGGKGINALTEAADVAPFGGTPLHDNKARVSAV
jgi:anaerobic selenocysteine-containing dehydrogenase